MSTQAETIREHGDRGKSKQSYGSWGSSEVGEVRLGGGSPQRKACSSEEEATTKRVGEHMPRPKKEETTKGMLKRRRRRRLFPTLKLKLPEEELRKIWEEQVIHEMEDKSAASEYSPIALAFYNKKHDSDFVLVDPVAVNWIYVGCGRSVLHVNFKAKKQMEDDRDAVMFFAEMGFRNPPTVIVCKILDASTDIQTYCRCCDPVCKIQHPVGEFDPSCQRDFIEPQGSVSELLLGFSEPRRRAFLARVEARVKARVGSG